LVNEKGKKKVVSMVAWKVNTKDNSLADLKESVKVDMTAGRLVDS
jgi:hypothetical protein